MYPVDLQPIAGMIVAVSFFLTVGGVLVLRPIARRLGEIVELFTKERRSGVEADVRQTRELLEQIDARLHLIEERQDFTERMLGPTTTETDSSQHADGKDSKKATSAGG